MWDAGTNFKRNFPHNNNNTSYNFRGANFPISYDLIAGIDWQPLEYFSSVEDASNLIYDKLFSVFDMCVPKFPTANKKKYPPWYNSRIIKNIMFKGQTLECLQKTW